MADLTGKSAIVTGGATLIGAAIGQRLVDAGAHVILADIAVEEGRQRAADIGEACHFVATDVTDDSAIDACIDTAIERSGGLDILVNVAATYLDNGAATQREDFLAGLNVNLVSQFIFAQKAAERMKEAGSGAIINTASISGKRAQPGRMVYAVSKAGVLHMTRCMAAALAADNIRVNSVSPGWTWSNVIKMMSKDDRGRADMVGGAVHPAGRIADPGEIGDAVVFLASNKSSFITGADVPVDGGYTAIGPERLDDMIPALSGEQ